MLELPILRDLGRRDFESVHREMLTLLDAVRTHASPGEVWLVEHDPVYTAGRATPDHQLVDGVVPIERGGKVTHHAPGQLVVYPIVRLPRKDVRAWLRGLETFGVELCRHFGLDAEPSADGTGVFVRRPGDVIRKVASIGVAIRHWINLHGIAVNVAMDLSGFGAIRPCGLDPEVMSDLSRELDREVSVEEAKAAAAAALPPLLGSGYAAAT